MNKKRLIITLASILILIALILTIIFTACSDVSRRSFKIIDEAVSKTNSEECYKASFVLEIRDVDQEELIMFVQGSYSINKKDGVILDGSIVQTVYNTPSSFRVGFYDDTYVTISNDYKVLNDFDEETLLKQFMCSPAISFSYDEIISIETSEVTDGTMYTVKAIDGLDKYFADLIGDDLYEFAIMKKTQKDLTEYKNPVCKYIVSEDGYLKSRETSYNIIAYDTVPYTPGVQSNQDDYKRNFAVSLKVNYKAFGDDVSVDISDFLPDESTSGTESKES